MQRQPKLRCEITVCLCFGSNASIHSRKRAWDFLEMLGLFLRQGYNLTEALNLMAEDEHRRIKKIAPVLLARLESGLSLADCLKMSFRKCAQNGLPFLELAKTLRV